MCRTILLLLLGVLASCSAAIDKHKTERHKTRIHTVCPEANKAAICEYIGHQAIQAAVDAAGEGDTIIIRSGTYVPVAYRDVAFNELFVRGMVVIENKNIRLIGEPGVIINGKNGVATSAIVTNNANIYLAHLSLNALGVKDPEDNIYDGHGIFFIDSQAVVNNVSATAIKKMSFSAHGSSDVELSNVTVADSHIGIWVEDSAKVQVNNSLFTRSDSAGICAYVNARVSIYNSIFEYSDDDGVYAENKAQIYVSNSIIRNNKPFGINATENSRIHVEYSVLNGNSADISTADNNKNITLGAGLIRNEISLANDYQPLKHTDLTDAGNPQLRDVDGSRSDIGLFGGLKAAAFCPANQCGLHYCPRCE